MNSTIARRSACVPVSAELNSWTTHDWRDGVLVSDLAVHDRVTVRTLNSTYEIIVMEPQTAEVLVRGGRFFPQFTPARVAGSSLGGSFLKLHGVYAGFQLELVTDVLPVITTRMRTVVVTASRDERVM
jgi:hypothetical protein